jgi:hypothetical protein
VQFISARTAGAQRESLASLCPRFSGLLPDQASPEPARDKSFTTTAHKDAAGSDSADNNEDSRRAPDHPRQQLPANSSQGTHPVHSKQPLLEGMRPSIIGGALTRQYSPEAAGSKGQATGGADRHACLRNSNRRAASENGPSRASESSLCAFQPSVFSMLGGNACGNPESAEPEAGEARRELNLDSGSAGMQHAGNSAMVTFAPLLSGSSPLAATQSADPCSCNLDTEDSLEDPAPLRRVKSLFPRKACMLTPAEQCQGGLQLAETPDLRTYRDGPRKSAQERSTAGVMFLECPVVNTYARERTPSEAMADPGTPRTPDPERQRLRHNRKRPSYRNARSALTFSAPAADPATASAPLPALPEHAPLQIIASSVPLACDARRPSPLDHNGGARLSGNKASSACTPMLTSAALLPAQAVGHVDSEPSAQLSESSNSLQTTSAAVRISL